MWNTDTEGCPKTQKSWNKTSLGELVSTLEDMVQKWDRTRCPEE